MANQPCNAAEAAPAQLRRVLGLPALVFFGLVYMVPLTIFTTYGIVTEITGGRTAGAYLVTLLAMLFTATSYSFMVKRFPVAGSAYSYTNLAFGPNVGFLAGWSLLLDYLFIPMINYLLIGLFLNIAFPAIPAWTIVLASIALVTVLNVIGIHSVAKASNLIVGAQIVFIGVFVALSWQTLGSGQPVDFLAPLVGDGSAPGFGSLMAGAAVLCLSFLGFDAVSTLAEECRDARRDVPRAIILTTLFAGLLFTVLAYISQLVLPGSTFANTDAAANEVMFKAGGQFLANFFTAAFVAGSLGSALASQAAVSRILFTMGRDKVLPKRSFGYLSPRFGTPVFAILLVSAFSLLALVIDLATLASLISFGALVAFSAVNLAVVKTHLMHDASQRNLKGLLRYGLVPLVGLSLTLWLWTSLSALTLVIGLCWFALGLAYLAVLTAGFRRPVRLVDFSESA
ncbi:APC family permease [Pseudomonas guariconensis]|uniref:APC family permease n=1 Tax=Pseudomonas TaxID=286 RepID=UPI0020976A64|nr:MULTISPECIES: APC family permease [Pseudomonas]MCO7638208.1 APC family permease [Pseudomonas sp. S 311-6]MCO7517760.1 APC family permease [Pseudomonas putida]MCO7568264.1 APC family permease [Pseudomonas mosselii]MCO7608244.1 APC family permease [Pseudomonas guariconensis]MCO7619950.1 APC family permease [Pseudomonas guariconensis]